MMRAPKFWERSSASLIPVLLSPFAALYSVVARARYKRTQPWKLPIPVLCIGNLVAGGAGKTPIAMAAATRLAARGVNAHFLTRGYGGQEKGPVLADPRQHTVRDVGDEALLLARIRPTWVARDRSAAARAAVAAGAEVLIMDDGFQNPSLAKDFSILVVDGTYGFGNHKTLPAGPLREPLDQGYARADAVIVMGQVLEDTEMYLPDQLPIMRARLAPGPGARDLAVKRVVAFAGIAQPEKFFETLEEIGCIIVSRREFPDHHPFSRSEIDRLVSEAVAKDARLVTTAKDAIRLPAENRLGVDVLEVNVDFDKPDQFELLLDALMATAQVY
jgi:tetraacyldisaccharide 4'-kinase